MAAIVGTVDGVALSFERRTRSSHAVETHIDVMQATVPGPVRRCPGMAEACILAWSRRAVAFVASGLLLVGCGSSATKGSSQPTAPGTTSTSIAISTTVDVTTTTTGRKDFAPGTFDTTDALLEERVRSAGLSR